MVESCLEEGFQNLRKSFIRKTTDKFSYLDEFALNVGRRCTSVLKLQSNHHLTFVVNQQQRFSFVPEAMSISYCTLGIKSTRHCPYLHVTNLIRSWLTFQSSVVTKSTISRNIIKWCTMPQRVFFASHTSHN
jgi:hypothetical protein